uniref:Uncharacterized protein n=1 Tax=Globodera rostochiensis TaxID=31243 RepID=A0A914HN13_GLORO
MQLKNCICSKFLPFVMPAALSLQDLHSEMNNNFPRSLRDRKSTKEQHSLLDGNNISNGIRVGLDGVEFISEELGVLQQQLSTERNVEGTSVCADFPIPEVELEQNILAGETQEQPTTTHHRQHYHRHRNEATSRSKNQRGRKVIAPTAGKQNEGERNVNIDEVGDEFRVLVNDFIAFLAIARRHRLQPKARAILLNLLHRIMPQDNQCPKTIAEMRKLVACDERTHSGLFGEDVSLHLASRNVPLSIQPQTHYLLPFLDQQQTSTSHNSNSSKLKRPSSSSERFLSYHKDETAEFLGDLRSPGGELVEEQTRAETGVPSMFYQPDVLPANSILLPHILQTIDRLTQEMALLRESLHQTQSQFGAIRKVKRRAVFSTDARVGLHIYAANGNKVPLSSLTHDELQKTVNVSRNDGNRLVYDHSDITELVLEKMELTPYLHNPSLCGRMVADVLFSPEFLSNKHILAEGQVSSRARLELLPPEMTHLFYESLRKLGVSRLAEEDREHWLYLARDGVNQRARDLKANRKRKFYTDEHPPLFNEDQII